MGWMIMPLQRYFDFQGRSRRKEYWMFFLLIIAGAIVTSIIDGVLGMAGSVGGLYGPATVLWLLAIIIPSLSCQVRRFHDQDKSGWFVLLGFIPIVGGIIVLVFMCLEGTKGPNSYGPDPKNPYDEEVFS